MTVVTGIESFHEKNANPLYFIKSMTNAKDKWKSQNVLYILFR